MAKVRTKKENALDRYISRYGSLDYIKPNEVQRLAIGIFKDLAYGNITQADIDKYSTFFLDHSNLDNLIIVAAQRTQEATIHCNALEEYFKVYQSEAQNPVATNLHRKDYATYTVFNTFVNTLTSVKNTGDIRYLYSISHVLQTVKRTFPNIIQ